MVTSKIKTTVVFMDVDEVTVLSTEIVTVTLEIYVHKIMLPAIEALVGVYADERMPDLDARSWYIESFEIERE